MTVRSAPATPDATPVRVALNGSGPLTRLRQLMADSSARFEAIRASLPDGLAAHVTPGPLDDEGWSLLAANGSVAAKLRQVEPRLSAALSKAGWPGCAIRIKVQAQG